MAKKGMKRPSVTHTKPKNDEARVPEISGKAKDKKEKANPIIAGTEAPAMKVYHSTPHSGKYGEKPISNVYKEIDTDLARDNLENDMTEADKEEL